jgi:membrane-associated phospholipid phosphatase
VELVGRKPGDQRVDEVGVWDAVAPAPSTIPVWNETHVHCFRFTQILSSVIETMLANHAARTAPLWLPLVLAPALWLPYACAAALAVALKVACQWTLPPAVSMRPDGTAFGMPSGHCLLAAFVAVSVAKGGSFASAAAAAAAVAYMAYTRVAVFGRHTVLQTVAGAVVGSVVALFVPFAV